MIQKIIDISNGDFYIAESFSVTSATTLSDLLAYFAKDVLTMSAVYKDYSNGTVYNLAIKDGYFTITFYFDKERLTHFSFIPSASEVAGSFWENYDRDAEMIFMTAWMAGQVGDKKTFVWNLGIAGRQYHFPYQWGAVGVYFDFKDGSFSCVMQYNQ